VITSTTRPALNSGKIFRFLIFGGLTFVIYYAILWICFDLAALLYREAVAISYASAIFFHFLANREVTFNAGGANFWQQVLRYIAVAILNYIIQLIVIQFCYESYRINFYLSTFFGVVTTMITGYFLMNSWVFKVHKL
jgi:putative flippase GtrA